MFDDFIHHIQVLSKVDSLIARIWLAAMARRFTLSALAGLIAVFGLGMADLAAFFQLQTSLGNVWAAAIVAAADFIIAALMAFYAGRAKPGPELEVAMEVRGLAIKSFQEDAHELEAGAQAFMQQARDAKNTLAGLVSNPLDAAAQKLLLPAVIAVVRGLRRRRGKGDRAPGG